MEITEKNFKQQLPVVLKAIQDADFLSFDCEFTGLGEGAAMILPFDTPALVYHKAKTNLSNFLVLQFGLSTFNYDAVNSKYRLNGVLGKFSSEFAVFSADFFIDRSIFSFFRDCPKNWRVVYVKKRRFIKVLVVKKNFDEFYKTDEIEHVIDNIQLYGVGSLFFDLEIDNNKVGRLKISKCQDEAQFKEMAKRKHEEKLAILDEAAGFCTIIKAISKSNKILIGHNIYLDLLHTLKAFCCDLPTNYEDFKKLVRQWFPKLVDTKVLVSQPLLKKHFGFANSLNQIYERLKHAPFRTIVSSAAEDEYAYKHCSENLHEAGYDAYLTGLIFVHLADFLAVNKSKTRLATNCYDIAWELISPMFNKLAPGRVLDMPCFDLALTPEADMVPDRSHVFHLTFSKEEWTSDHITQLFSIFGGVQVAWIDDNSCFVTLKDRKQIKMVQQNLIYRTNKEEKQWKLKPSIEYFMEQESLIGSRSKFCSSRKTNQDSKKSNDDQDGKKDTASFLILKTKEARMSVADNLRLKKMKLDSDK